ncbi:MAG: hypothetical protein EXX96DRAFT_526886 [Benjaminiella poitrasii]|nr:MAG: hypothetical protein EXX96DRAFT_526886 [Benjaminiella poitrasii]
MNQSQSTPCLLQTTPDMSHFQPRAEDILTDEDLLELFRIVKQIIRKKPDTERIAKLYFCVVYAMGDLYPFYKPIHSDCIIFRDESNTTPVMADVQLPSSTSCSCGAQAHSANSNWKEANSTNNNEVSTDQYSVRPYTNIRPIYPSLNYPLSPSASWPSLNEQQHQHPPNAGAEVLMEPKQRGFYYQDNRITREPALLQRYAEQGVLTQASLIRKRKKAFGNDQDFAYDLSTIPAPIKKPKIPHRHGEFNQRRDDIISRMRTIMMADLEQKAQRLPSDFTLRIEKATLPTNLDVNTLSTEEASKLLMPALHILTEHSNMKPHLDNGMNQNGIYYNDDYFRLYLAFVQFQNIFSELFPNEVIKITTSTSTTPSMDDTSSMPSPNSIIERDKDRERNANMKAYRGWIEPYLTETNWAAFRRNIMVGERIMQLTKVVGQGVLLMTKELSGSKLHLTFTNNEWDEFIQGLNQGLWDDTIDWSHDEDDLNEESRKQAAGNGSILVSELRLKFATHFWFTEDGRLVPSNERKALRAKERQNNVPGQLR